MPPIIADCKEQTDINIKPAHLFKPGQSGNINGRPPGTHNKLSIKSLLAQLSDTLGQPYEQQLAENYREAIVSQDRKVIQAYDNLFLSKLLADKVSLEVAESQEIIDQKRQAFKASLEAYQQHTLTNANHAETYDNLSLSHDIHTVELTVTQTVPPL